MLGLGSQGAYEWLVTDENFDLLQLCPEIVLAKYVAVTSIDSGHFVPTEQETAAGCQSRGKIGYSPKLKPSKSYPEQDGMNGTSLIAPRTSARATSQKISLRYRKSTDT